MNYISQLTAAIDRLSEDIELNPSHVSLYLALFYQWNMNRFKNPISISRSEVMKVSKIGSKSTYHKCLKDLHAKGFLVYHPSHNPLRGSLIDMTIFGTTTRTSSGTSTEQVVGQPLVPSINNTNNLKDSNNKKSTSFYKPTLDEVKEFFNDNSSTELAEVESETFYNHFESNGWLVGGKAKMKNWQAAARNWIKRSQVYKTQSADMHGTSSGPAKNVGNLNVDQNKDYSVPL